MSKISCEVIKDLLPIYIDDIASEDSKKLVEEHIEECEACKKEAEALKKNLLPEVSDFTEEMEDTRMIKGLRRKIRRKQIVLVLIAVVITAIVSYFGMKSYMDSKRPEINGNQMITSKALGKDGEPKEILQDIPNGVEISKENEKVYISLPVNSKEMDKCHVVLLKDDKKIDDTFIKISEARFVTYCLENVPEMESGQYTLQYYDSNNDINQYKWFEIK